MNRGGRGRQQGGQERGPGMGGRCERGDLAPAAGLRVDGEHAFRVAGPERPSEAGLGCLGPPGRTV